MIAPPIPDDEAERLAALRELRILDTPAEERFDRITRIARDLFQVPIALVSLVDAERQWFKSRVGLDARETPRVISFCGHAILGDDALVVEDATADARFHDNPLVVGAPDIRFYAGTPLHSSGGKRLGTLCLIDRVPRHFDADDTQRLVDLAAWAERELNLVQQVDRAVAEMRDTFVRLVSHELRTPATGIVGALELIRGGIATGDNVDALARIASDSASQLTRVVDDIVEIAEIDAHHLDLTPSRIDLSIFLQAAMESFATAAERANVRITTHADPALIAHVAPKPLTRILRALIDNALCFSPSGTTVGIAAAFRDAAWLNISVTDQGPGVPADYVPRLFQPFVQADAQDNRVRSGIGIGLTVAQKLATAMGGRLGYEPAAGGGSRFTLELPR